MPIKKTPFTFHDDFQVVPMDSGSYMLEQGLNFSRGFSNLDEVVDFLIIQKDLFLNNLATTSEGGHSYEDYDRTGTPGYGKDDEDDDE